MQVEQQEYVGFWARVLATLVDSILVLVILLLNIVAIHYRNSLREKYRGLET